MTHPIAWELEHAYRAAADGDLDPLFQLMADDIRWHVNAGPLAGDYVGKPAVLGFFGRMLDLYDAYQAFWSSRERAVVGARPGVHGASPARDA